MIIKSFKQRSEDWFVERLGVLTASQVGNVITSTGKASTSWKKTACTLAAERETGESEYIPQTYWMKRGTELEPEAIKKYESEMNITVISVGMILTDRIDKIAASPDGIIKNDSKIVGGLELKCPAPKAHKEYQIDCVIPLKYRPQVYFSLFIADECEYWDFMSYHPDMKPFIIRTTRQDKDFIRFSDAAEKLLPSFLSDVDRYTDKVSLPKQDWLDKIFDDEFVL